MHDHEQRTAEREPRIPPDLLIPATRTRFPGNESRPPEPGEPGRPEPDAAEIVIRARLYALLGEVAA